MTFSTMQASAISRAKAKKVTSARCRRLFTAPLASAPPCSVGVIFIFATFLLMSLTQEQNYDKRHSFYIHGFTAINTPIRNIRTARSISSIISSITSSDEAPTRSWSTPISTQKLNNVKRSAGPMTILRADRSRENEIRRKVSCDLSLFISNSFEMFTKGI